MKIEVIEATKESLKFKMLNTRHSVPELLKNELLMNKDVEMASYVLEHFEDKDAIFFVKVAKGKDVKKAVLTTIESAKKELAGFTKSALEQLPKKKK